MRARILLVVAVSLALFCEGATETVPVCVRDADTERPVKGAKVGCWIERFGARTGSRVSLEKPGEPTYCLTDADGRCAFELERIACRYTIAVVEVPKGYYRGYQSDVRSALEETWTNRHDLCTRPAEFYLYSVMNPIGLRQGEVKDWPLWFKTGGDTLRYDMMKGEWLPPLGKGERADIVFVRENRVEGDWGIGLSGKRKRCYRDEVRIEFPGGGNGLVEMPPPRGAGLPIRTAPETGYASAYRAWIGTNGKLQSESSEERKRNFCFRIRTERDSEGKIVSAYYAKSLGGLYIRWGGLIDSLRTTGRTNRAESVGFRYELNPTALDRNLESD